MTNSSQNPISNPEKWFDENIKLYESLAANVANTLQTALDKHNIMYVNIPYRAKSKESFLKKWKQKQYNNFNNMTDMAGIRVITLVESDLDQVEEIIRQLFRVHEEDSGDKADKLGHDKFGYRSRHFVCDIGKEREKLLELEHLKDKCFEIQIRTALAHAWAEIEHDRGYKLEGGLPPELKRRLNIVAAFLEGADNEFNRLTKDIEDYKNSIKESIKNNDLNIPIDPINISALLSEKYPHCFDENLLNSKIEASIWESLKSEIEHMEIDNIQKLDNYIIKNITNLDRVDLKSKTDIGFLRTLFMLSDPEKYFSQELAFLLYQEDMDFLVERLGEERIKNLNLPEIIDYI